MDVGGVNYSTLISTLIKYPDSLLGFMFSGKMKLEPDSNERYFIDRNGKIFEYILDYLRTDVLELPKNEDLIKQIKSEF